MKAGMISDSLSREDKKKYTLSREEWRQEEMKASGVEEKKRGKKWDTCRVS